MDLGALGLAAAWAKGNIREAIWDAFDWREVLATTGTRLCVRAFAGWDFGKAEVRRPTFAWVSHAAARFPLAAFDRPLQPPSGDRTRQCGRSEHASQQQELCSEVRPFRGPMSHETQSQRYRG
ncbi:hypothetical protein CEW88_18435 [Alloyangia pacifica]|uniref:Uncharacterized protein n=1 Tax=Alloyangia pacifica TaxID=311180 RepID=A0A2U8HIW3_9RHOB|nr:hypothetical protein CEW88_18435 [Alloyangia pacifica]